LNLSALLAALAPGQILVAPTADPQVSAPVSEDDRLIQPGGVFVARKGASNDGHERIPNALERGAAAIIGERPPKAVNSSAPYAQIMNAMFALGPLAAAYEGFPSRSLIVIGVTGTDGKTTTTNLIYHILKTAGLLTGMISTVNAVIGDESISTGLHVTTPGAPDVQRYLRRMADAGLKYCVLETTSHGLAQGRVRGVEYDVAALTNLTHEHLDFHGTFAAYRDAKADLFRQTQAAFRKPAMDRRKAFILNADDTNASYFAALCSPGDTRYFSLNPDGASPRRETFRATNVQHNAAATTIRVSFAGRERLDLATRLAGDFNIANVLTAVAVTSTLIFNGNWKAFTQTLQAALDTLPAIPGRMERIDAGQDYLALVDFAHTPSALRSALEAARTLIAPDKRIICVFGCAGLRDREKRRLMSEAALELATISIFTAEDPRTEPLDGILAVMAEAATTSGGVEGQTFWRIPDRGQALAFACGLAQPGDVVIACGKGHEQSMAFGMVEYPWDDRAALRAAISGVALRTLPTAENT